jgi:hypothetical protein
LALSTMAISESTFLRLNGPRLQKSSRTGSERYPPFCQRCELSSRWVEVGRGG